jgi:DNA invertase Pin-like site-specific DNA recombinase
MKPTANAVIYCRISRDSDLTGLGVARQEKECRALCEREGFNVAAVYVDNDVSAYKGKARPGWQEVEQALRSRTVDVLVAWHPDRLTRRTTELEGLIDLIEGSKVQVRTVSAGAINLSTASGRMTARIVGAVAQGESELKSERLKSKARQLASEGKVGGLGTRPFGYEGDGVTIREGEADAIRWAASELIKGRSLYSIAQRMPVPPVKAAKWNPNSLRTIFKSARIMGWRSYEGELAAKAVWPAIIDRETWDQLQAILDDPARRPSKGRKRSYLLSGLLTDTEGRKLNSGPVGGVRTYKTPPGNQGGVSVKADPVERLVLTRALEVVQAMSFHPQNSGRRTATQGESVEVLESELAELAALRGEGQISLAEWMSARKPLQERLEAAQAAVQPPSTPVDDLRRLASKDKISLEDARLIIDAVFTSITVAPVEKRGSTVFDPERISYEYREGAKPALAALALVVE